MKVKTNNATEVSKPALGPTGRVFQLRTSMPLPVVLTATVSGAVVPPLSCTEGAEHVAASGAPVHVNDALPLKPAPGVTSKLKFAVCPAVMEIEVPPDDAAVMVSAGLTLAAMLIIWGESGASSVMVMTAERAPSVTGEKATPIVQVVLTA